MCFVFIWEQTATCGTYSINWLVLLTEMKSVYSAVRTGALNKAVCASAVKGSAVRLWETSGFCREGDDNCAFLGYYVACSDVSRQPIGPVLRVQESKKFLNPSGGNFLPTFRDNLSTPTSIHCPETSVRNYYSLRNSPEACSSHHAVCTCFPRVLFNL